MKSKGLSLLLVLSLVVGTFSFGALPVMAGSSSYQDTGSHWAKTEIDKWSDYGVLMGSDGNFRPEDPITRGEMAVILDRVMKYQGSWEQ